MYIRRTQIRSSATGEHYTTYRLVCSERLGGKVRQRTLLNLGRHFAVDPEYWPVLCQRIDELLSGQQVLLAVELPAAVERQAQRIAAQLLARAAQQPASTPASGGDLQTVDADSMALVRPRTVGVESLGLWAMQQLDFSGLLRDLGFSGPQQAAALGSIIGRMAQPGSELATWQWLQERSGLGELLDVDYEAMTLESLYRVSDRLHTSRAVIERVLFERVSDLFGFSATVTLFDLTNTFFEGAAQGNAKAKRGRSKEKRSDCPLVTLGLVLDGSGFVRRSEVFAGNVSEATTLAGMLEGLQAPRGALVVMDRGIATAPNIQWLRDQGYGYLVVSRERQRQFDPERAVCLHNQAGEAIHLEKQIAGDEVLLYCHSEARAAKERAIDARFAERFEAGLNKIAAGLQQKGRIKRLDKVWERIGRLKEKSRGVAQHYRIEVSADASGKQAVALSFRREPLPGTQATHPGVYCLRSSQTDWDEAQLWRTYILLTDLEAVFRSLKSELGLRPIYHRTTKRTEGHLFITVLAYQFVQILRRSLGAQGIGGSWNSLRKALAGQVRVTAVFRQPEGRALHIRKATRPEGLHRQICQALNITEQPGGVYKTRH